jgi:ABC-type transport system involved in multi-copper enzyme maturation permease subunit
MSGRTSLFVQRELAGSLRARWFLAYAAIFLLAGVLLTTFGLADSAIHGYRGFAKAFAGLVHLALLFVPLMALFPATAAIAEDRESGALEYVLAQPVTFGEVYAGKWGGVGVAVVLALTVGFGAAGGVAVLRGVPPGLVALLYLFVLLLAMGFVSLGLCFSTIAHSRARATTMGILTFVRWGLPASVLIVWSFVNPIEAFRIGVVCAIDPDLSLLGPVGADIVQSLGSGGTVALAGVSLLAWAVVPGLIGWRLFRRVR